MVNCLSLFLGLPGAKTARPKTIQLSLIVALVVESGLNNC